ncbi:hypothetical protein DERP_008399 [Dermatophagoides pteronyssinus]|uniref:Uncharacterized protein n=1 Tax=Dermatophagoides pteronyssinus TaxID=6956 RepID=A0ABQ8IVA0_DERPT|nr:hypothetical protein DERP_008399 [Dermatophagoides pteronyssinus]
MILIEINNTFGKYWTYSRTHNVMDGILTKFGVINSIFTTVLCVTYSFHTLFEVIKNNGTQQLMNIRRHKLFCRRYCVGLYITDIAGDLGDDSSGDVGIDVDVDENVIELTEIPELDIIITILSRNQKILYLPIELDRNTVGLLTTIELFAANTARSKRSSLNEAY